MGYKVVFYRAGETPLNFKEEIFSSAERALKWKDLVLRNGYEWHSTKSVALPEGIRV